MFFRKTKRKYPRVTPEKNFPIRVDITGENFLDILYANDISDGGVNITVSHSFEGCHTGSLVTLIVKLPQPVNHSINVTARIISVSQNRFGAVFENLGRSDRKKIHEYVEYRIKSSYMDKLV